MYTKSHDRITFTSTYKLINAHLNADETRDAVAVRDAASSSPQ